MAIYFIEGVSAPVVGYNFEKSVAALPVLCPKKVAVLAGGFFCTQLPPGVLEDPRSEFSPEEQKALQGYVGKEIIWMEESSLELFTKQQLMAILRHEEAHIINGDLEGVEGIVDDLDAELAADAYAAKTVGKKAMKFALMKAVWHIVKRTSVRGKFGKIIEFLSIIGSGDIKQRLDALRK